MHWSALILIAVAGNLDNGGVGVAYGLRRIRISPPVNLMIAGIAFLGTAAFGLAGSTVAAFFPPGVANALGAALIIAIGLWVALAAKLEPSGPGPSSILHNPGLADKDASGDISLKEGLLLGFALGLNAWVGGLGAGLLGISPWLEAAATAAASFMMLGFGDRLGHVVSSRALGRWAPRVAGLLLMLIGLHQLM